MSYAYPDHIRPDILGLIPADGMVIGSIGCSFGGTEAQLVLQGRQVHGVDVSEEAVRVAATRLTSARVISECERQPFAPNSLDGLILADVLEHIPRAWLALADYSQAIRPGGWVVISVPNMRYVDVMIEFLWRGDWPECATGLFDETHIQVMTRRRLERWCRGADLTIERWFDCFDPNSPRRRRIWRTLDALSLGLARSWFMFELQCRCRKPRAEFQQP